MKEKEGIPFLGPSPPHLPSPVDLFAEDPPGCCTHLQGQDRLHQHPGRRVARRDAVSPLPGSHRPSQPCHEVLDQAGELIGLGASRCGVSVWVGVNCCCHQGRAVKAKEVMLLFQDCDGLRAVGSHSKLSDTNDKILLIDPNHKDMSAYRRCLSYCSTRIPGGEQSTFFPAFLMHFGISR